MMYLIRASLFQTIKVVSDENGPLDLGSPTTQSLFAYLLLHRAQPSDRRRLAFLFWPQSTETAARRNLRQYIHRLRRSLGVLQLQTDLILTDSTSLQINPQARIWLDVEAFLHGTRPEATPGEWQSAISLYTGDLLEGVYEDWCQAEREHLRRVYINTLNRLSHACQMDGNFELALSYAQRWAAADPLDEVAHRNLMTLFSLKGDRTRAIHQYQILAQALAEELNTEPSLETRALLKTIEAEDAQKGPIPLPSPSHPRQLASRPAFPLISREVELEKLEVSLQRGRRGHGGFVLITGESGIGKTRLVQEYLSRHPDLHAITVTCEEFESGVPSAPLRTVMREAASRIPQGALHPAPPWLIRIVSLLSESALYRLYPPIDTAYPVEEINFPEALRELVYYHAAHIHPPPLHLIFDDLHWADHSTWELLSHLCIRAPELPLLIVGLCRLEDLTSERAKSIRRLESRGLLQQIPLSRLSLAETATLAGQHTPLHQLDPHFLRRLFRETEGNPFFVIETVRAVRETGSTLTLSPDWSQVSQSLYLPLSVQRVIEARLERLSSTSRELLATAATIGSGFKVSLLAKVGRVSSEESINIVEEWMQRGLIWESDHDYEFSHNKIRQVAYGSLSRARRQYLHRQIAEELANSIPSPDINVLAHHYAHSDRPLLALDYLTQAGEQALQVHAYHEARQFGQRAISLLGQIPGPEKVNERIDLYLQLARAHAFTGDLIRSQEILSQTEQLATALGDEPRLGFVFYRTAQVQWLRGQPNAARDDARRALRTAEELNDAELLRASLRMLGRVSIALSTFDDAIAYLQRGIKLEENVIGTTVLPVLLGYLGVAYSRVGSWARALEASQEGLELARRHGSAQTYAFASLQMASIHADRRSWSQCLKTVEAIPDPRNTDQRLTPVTFMSLSLHGWALVHSGQIRAGIEEIRYALNWAAETDYRIFHYLPRFFLAEGLLLSGETASAQREALRVLAEAGEAGNRWVQGITSRLLAEIISRRPNPDWSEVETRLVASMHLLWQIRARPDLARTHLALRKLYDRAGQIAWAVDCHFRAVSIFDELGMVHELRQAQGHAASGLEGESAIPDLRLLGPNQPFDEGET